MDDGGTCACGDTLGDHRSLIEGMADAVMARDAACSVSVLMDAAVAVLVRALPVDLAAVAERVAAGRVVLRAGAGWKPGSVGRTEVAASTLSLALDRGEPLVCDDVARQPNSFGSPLLADHDVISAAVVSIPGWRARFGMLGVFSQAQRHFGTAEVDFLVAVAGVLAGAIERAQRCERVLAAVDVPRPGERDRTATPRVAGPADLRLPAAPARDLRARSPGPGGRMLLVDGYTATREALALAFAREDGFVITGQAGSLAEARPLLEHIDVATVDLVLPDGDGADLIGELREHGARALVLTAHADRRAMARAVEKGAAGVVAKDARLRDVVGAVRRVLAGEPVMPADEVIDLLRLAARERERDREERRCVERLTPREVEVLALLAQGLDSRTVAARLHISLRTQRNHVSNILAKLGVHSQLQAIVCALRQGAVELE